LSGCEHDVVVEAEVLVASRAADALGERRLAALPRAMDEHDWAVLERCFEGRCGKTRKNSLSHDSRL
jgi:hypothetical protein